MLNRGCKYVVGFEINLAELWLKQNYNFGLLKPVLNWGTQMLHKLLNNCTSVEKILTINV